jgi:hypothetical protein
VGVLVLPKGSYNGAEVLALLIQFKSIILHTNVQFCKELVSNVLLQDICDNGQEILLVLNYLVQLSKVADPAYASILFENNEGRTSPFALLLRNKDTNVC